MELTNGKVLQINVALHKLGKNEELPFKVRYAIARSLNAIKPVIETIKQAELLILEEYGQKNENGFIQSNEGILLKEGCATAYDKAVKELHNEIAPEIKWHSFKYELLENSKVAAIDESILFDTVIQID